MIAWLFLLPWLAGIAAFLLPWPRLRRALLPAVALAHLALAGWCVITGVRTSDHSWIGLDPLGGFFLLVASTLFAAVSFYAHGYLSALAQDKEHAGHGRESVVLGCLLFFLGAISLVTVARHFGLLWVAVEATTLATAPLVYFHHNPRSLEAAWKYVLICSVGIAIALVGNFLLAIAATSAGPHVPLMVRDLVARGAQLHDSWMQAAFIFLLVGYGTKMGLAPLHTWLPDAHSEAPAFVSALLSGALLNGAFLAILRVLQVCAAAGQILFAQKLLMGFGILSLAVAAIFIVRQADYKRLLAYSSVEHMGLLALATGVGTLALPGMFLQVVNHSCIKAALFLAAGNILSAFGTRKAREVSGVMRVLPATGIVWTAGLFAISGAPPFGTFLSELLILRGAFLTGHYALAGGALLALAVIFIGMSAIFQRMTRGDAPPEQAPRREWLRRIAPPILLLAVSALLGLYVPEFLRGWIQTMINELGF